MSARSLFIEPNEARERAAAKVDAQRRRAERKARRRLRRVFSHDRFSFVGAPRRAA